MKKDDMVKIEGYFEAFIIISLIILFLLMISDYLLAILFASSLVFLLYKPYLYLKKKLGEYSAAFFMTLMVTICLFLPLYLVGVSIYEESSQLISNNEELFSELSLGNCPYQACNTFERNLVLVGLNVDSLTNKVASYFSNSLGSFFSSVTSLIINILIFILSLFFFLKDGEKFMKYVKRIIPMKNEYKDALFLRFRQVSSAIFVDSILVALVQGILVGIGLYFTGFNSPVFWSIIASFLALLPFIGAAFVWLPAVLYLLLIGDFTFGIGLLIYGIVIVSMSDNLLRPILMHHKVPVHSFLIFLSILGGMGYFGILGLFLGPIIISLLVSVLQLYKLDFK
jgi:predicted PurR-regulated permease PerM